jgi:hypothetical protein
MNGLHLAKLGRSMLRPYGTYLIGLAKMVVLRWCSGIESGGKTAALQI